MVDPNKSEIFHVGSVNSKRNIDYGKVDDEKNACNAYVPYYAYRPSHGDWDRGFSFHLELPRCKTDRREAQSH